MPDITKTRTDLIERAATELGVLPSGQPLADEDAATIGALVDPLLRQLSLDDVVDAVGHLSSLTPTCDWERFDAWCAHRDGRVAERLADLVDTALADYERFASHARDDSFELRWARFGRRWRNVIGRRGPAEPQWDRVLTAVHSLSPASLAEFLR